MRWVFIIEIWYYSIADVTGLCAIDFATYCKIDVPAERVCIRPTAPSSPGEHVMKINADLSKRAQVDSDKLAWVASPLPGVERRMLERDGEEVARVTSLVRYAPGSHFSAHTHTGGEEFLVLEGTFSDDYGDFPAGTYVRNPVGSKHAPHSHGGTVILVKLWWMDPADQAFVRIDTTREDQWQPSDVPGVEIMALHGFQDESVALVRLAPGTALPVRDLPGGEEFFVLAGTCRDEDGSYGVGTWRRTPIGAAPTLFSDEGCRIYVKRGHLLNPPPGPNSLGTKARPASL
jgi:anti-sigma factor ChrR (cupin superfamily)